MVTPTARLSVENCTLTGIQLVSRLLLKLKKIQLSFQPLQSLALMQVGSQCTSTPVTAATTPTTPSTIPRCQKILRPESSVIEVMTRAISKKTSARS